jgi:hypothetical protein
VASVFIGAAEVGLLPHLGDPTHAKQDAVRVLVDRIPAHAIEEHQRGPGLEGAEEVSE